MDIQKSLQRADFDRRTGRLSKAAQICHEVLAIEPEQPYALYLLGLSEFQSGKKKQGIAAIQQALRFRPEWPEAHHSLGIAFTGLGKLDEAIKSYRRALELKANVAEVHYNLGVALAAQGKLDEAVASYRCALALKPDYIEAHNNLGAVLQEQDRADEAVESYHRMLDLKPDIAEAHYNLGIALKALGKLDAAVASYRRALELKPDYPQALCNLGVALAVDGHLDEAIASYYRALDLKPDYADAHNNLGNALIGQGKWGESISAYRRALELNPDFVKARSNLLLALHYWDRATLADLAAAHAEYDRVHAAPLRSSWQPHEIDRSSERPLRLGFVSGDLGEHPVGFFLIRVLENFDRQQCEIVCYSDRNKKDELTARFMSAASLWRETSNVDDGQLAQSIRADKIDILFDLAGHCAKNRLLVFARKPAPIQVTWAGYVGTTGLAAMDYILADRYEIPREAEQFYSEQVLRMPDGYVCYEAPAYAPSVSALPALSHGFVTFGSFNNPTKIAAPVLETWSTILRRVPQAKLILKYKGMDDKSTVNRLREGFSIHGINPERIECQGWSPHESLLAEYNRVDIALDPFPYGGGLTTCEALWMGVPVVTCPGQTFASRHSLSHLSAAGLTETIGHDRSDYVELAVSLANNLPHLAELRTRMRGRLAASPLCDGRRFARNLMQVVRQIWRKWCGSEF
jgi:predicted O-linked N-acetylglucosamine transferase (SPINDLY family)